MILTFWPPYVGAAGRGHQRGFSGLLNIPFGSSTLILILTNGREEVAAGKREFSLKAFTMSDRQRLCAVGAVLLAIVMPFMVSIVTGGSLPLNNAKKASPRDLTLFSSAY